jgi:hypothetical protein
MLQPNLMVAAAAALFPLVFGFIWYNPKVFGNAWMKGAGLTEESAKGANMLLVFGLTYVFSFLIALSLNFVTIHQYGLQSLILPENGKPVVEGAAALGAQVMEAYKSSYRSFKHGALHGTINAIFFVLPLLGVGSLFERRGWKYLLINVGYWVVCMAVMGGIVCQWG